MNLGLLTKNLRETWIATLLFGTALFVVEAVFGYVLPELFDQFADLWLQAPFIRSIFKVLTGTEMPAILAEISCVSNESEERLLMMPSYRQYLAEALFRGIESYARSLNPDQKAEDAGDDAREGSPERDAGG